MVFFALEYSRCDVGRMAWYDEFVVVFFFKQKTEYEMRIVDCSSDVCSSDLARRGGAGAPCGRWVSPRARVHRDSRLSADARQHREDIAGAHPAGRCDREKPRDETHPGDDGRACKRFGGECDGRAAQPGEQHAIGHERGGAGIAGARSEETTELQSLMRISYAVFCLNKKKSPKKEQRAK